MDLHCEQQKEVMEISSEGEEKKTETSLSSNYIRQGQKQVKVAQNEKHSTDSSDSVSDNESRRTQ
jgi:hypothetical protein